MDSELTPETGNSEEFAAIENLARTVDAAAHEAVHGEAPEPTAAQVAAADPVLQWMFVPMVLRSLILPALPEVAPSFSDENCRNVAEQLHVCDQAYGWGGARIPPWAGLLMAAMPMGTATFIAIKARRDAAERARDADAKARSLEPQQFTGPTDGNVPAPA